MIDTGGDGPQRPRRIRADLDGDVGRRMDEGIDEDEIFGDDGGIVVLLAPGRVVAGGAAAVAGRCRVGTVVEDQFLVLDRRRRVAGLVRGNVGWEHVAPAVVGHVLDVAVGAVRHAGNVVEGADVVRFTVVVPGEDLCGRKLGKSEYQSTGGEAGIYLDELGLGVDDLLPAIVPQVVAVPEPVLAGQVGVKPGRDTHHVGLVAGLGQDVLPGRVDGRIHAVGSVGPHVPGERAIDLLESVRVRALEAGPFGNDKSATDTALDAGPVADMADAFKGGDDGEVVVSGLR